MTYILTLKGVDVILEQIKTAALENRIFELAALEPCYGRRGGNAVRVYTRDGGSFEMEKRTCSLLKNICAFFNADLTSLRKNYGAYLGCRQYIPLPLSPGLVLVPVKMRRPGYGNDGATGFVNLFDVEKTLKPGPKEGLEEACCLLHLKGGHVLPSLFSLENTERRLNTARVAYDRFLSLQNKNSSTNFLQRNLEELFNEKGFEGLVRSLLMLALSQEANQ